MDTEGYVRITLTNEEGLISDGPVTRTKKTLGLREELPKHVAELRARAMKLTKNPALAEDVLQETFLRALRFEDRYVPGTNVRAWLYQILFSVFVTGYRKRKRETRAFSRYELESHAVSDMCASDAVSTLSPGTARALASMPQPFLDVLMMVDVCDLSYRDVATQLDVPLGTVMSRLHRARRMAAELLTTAANGTPVEAAVAAEAA